MSRKYKFKDNTKLYFVSFAVINWIDVFIRRVYKDILIESWKYCIHNKDLDICAWCKMTSHVHMIIGSRGFELENIMRDMKSHTSLQLKNSITEIFQESRRKWMLWMMHRAGKINGNNQEFQFWQQHNQPIVLDSNYLIEQKLNYLHCNPVEAGFSETPEEYLYSSARDYAGQKAYLKLSLLNKFFNLAQADACAIRG